MARNLQAKLPSSDTLRIYDINPQTLERFANETKALSGGASVEIAENVREAAENSVGPLVLAQSIYIPSSACFN
jgi:3-hydroxyisobutyrate/3-hydroxypropionate dehydrogenase